jgi:superfamily II DNA helicase RecQ
MKDQVRKLCESGVSACYLDMAGAGAETYKLKSSSVSVSKDDESGKLYAF